MLKYAIKEINIYLLFKHLYKGEENLGGMKTRVNRKPQIQAPPLTQVWEIKWEKEK